MSAMGIGIERGSMCGFYLPSMMKTCLRESVLITYQGGEILVIFFSAKPGGFCDTMGISPKIKHEFCVVCKTEQIAFVS